MIQSPVNGSVDKAREFLRDFYGRAVQRTEDLQFGACCVDDGRSRFQEILDLIPEEVKSRQYGCGSPIPMETLEGLSVLDLGSGAGTDSFILSRLVGPAGRVVGIDMTDEQLAVAQRNVSAVCGKFGYAAPNVDFRKDFIETAESVEDESVDLAVSNCVINLSPLKEHVFRSIWRVLRPGGEFYISDIVCDRRLPEEIRKDPLLYGECLAGADYYNDLRDTMAAAGFRDVREVSKRALEDKVGREGARFCSVTLRGFKLPELDRRCEDYGQFAEYLGTCGESPVEFRLDGKHLFEAGRPVAICRNTALMLSRTRLGRYFSVSPERKHFGLFDCSPSTAPPSGAVGPACCP
ncbi:MAG: methyltransferase domain-containing protein [Acidobacteria bacterium]|nr:methyltransferase domain-containing protein [Acidobacteriota bacterium]